MLDLRSVEGLGCGRSQRDFPTRTDELLAVVRRHELVPHLLRCEPRTLSSHIVPTNNVVVFPVQGAETGVAEEGLVDGGHRPHPHDECLHHTHRLHLVQRRHVHYHIPEELVQDAEHGAVEPVGHPRTVESLNAVRRLTESKFDYNQNG